MTPNRSAATRTTARRIRIGGLVAAGVASLTVAGSAAAAPNGPVILGGDNFAKQGLFNSSTSALENGWFAMKRELEYVAPKVGRLNDNSIAVIGASPSTAILDDAGAAIGRAASATGYTTTYADGADAINALFDRIDSGAAIPRVLWIAGNGSSNGTNSAEISAINARAGSIATFVAGGGGLIAHGDTVVFGTPTQPGWLANVMPGLEAYGTGAVGLASTAAGSVALPGITIDASPWRNAFRGDLGGLTVFAEASGASGMLEPPANVVPQKVVLGGGTAWATLAPANLRVSTSAPKVVDRGDTFTYIVTVTNRGPNAAGPVTIQDVVPTGFAVKSAVPDRGTCTLGQVVTCSLDVVGVNAKVKTRITVKALTHGTRQNRVEARASTPDPSLGDLKTISTTTSKLTRLRVKVVVPKDALEGKKIKVRLSVTNIGARSAKGVILRNPTPPGFTLPRRPAGARVEDGAAIWELGNIAPGRTRIAEFALRINPETHGLKCIAGLARARNANFTSGRDCLMVFLTK